MRKNCLSLVLFLGLFTSQLMGGLQFKSHIIYDDLFGASSVYAIDLDGDGDIDVVSSGYKKIIWHENDGQQNFITRTLSENSNYIDDIYAVDFDHDGDIDVLGCERYGKILWYENDGFQNFSENIITDNLYGRHFFTVDLDSDDDFDILAEIEKKLVCFENDGNQNFDQFIVDSMINASSRVIHSCDLDNDQDMDIIYQIDGGIVRWYENVSYRSFNNHTISSAPNTPVGVTSIYALDLDKDMDMDFLTSSWADNRITWFENDGRQNFVQHIISAHANEAYSVFAIDIDDDADIDILSASRSDYTVAWYENDGNQKFRKHIIISDAKGANRVYAIDLDNDGDMDAISSSSTQWNYSIRWYENLGYVEGLETLQKLYPTQLKLYSNYPNPFNSSTSISYFLPEKATVTISIYDINGRMIESLFSNWQNSGNHTINWNANEHNSGVYFIKLTSGSISEVKKCMLIK